MDPIRTLPTYDYEIVGLISIGSKILAYVLVTIGILITCVGIAGLWEYGPQSVFVIIPGVVSVIAAVLIGAAGELLGMVRDYVRDAARSRVYLGMIAEKLVEEKIQE